MFAGLQLKIIIILIVASLAGGGYLYFKNVQAQLALAIENQKQLEDVVESQNVAIEQQKEDVELMRELNKEISQDFREANSQVQNLQERFTQSADGQPRNLGNTAFREPSMIEERINRGTRFALRCNEIVTGSPVTEADADNNICPNLVNKGEAQ